MTFWGKVQAVIQKIRDGYNVVIAYIATHPQLAFWGAIALMIATGLFGARF